jgi:hypothetical protein
MSTEAETTLAVREETVTLPSGRSFSLDRGSDTLVFRAPNGACVLQVELTDQGPRLRFESAAIEIVAPRSVSIASERVEIIAGSMSVDVARDMSERIGGDARRVALGNAAIAGADLELEACSGTASIRANDDVEVTGERVRLNCDDPPMPVSWEEHERRSREGRPRLPAR